MLGAVIEITGDNGEIIRIGYTPFIFAGLQVVLFLLPLILIILYFFYRRRLEHKQILAAIEKGIAPTDLHLSKTAASVWIKNLTAGITLLLIAIGLIGWHLLRRQTSDVFEDWEPRGWIFIVVILSAFGITRVIRGLLQRKTEQQAVKTESSK